jgi:hypothetical protein
MEATKLPLTKWFQAFYLVGDAKTGAAPPEWHHSTGRCVKLAFLHSPI